MTEHTIPDGVGAIPLPRYLARAFPMLPGWALRDAVKKRDVRVNGKKWDGRALLKDGDRLNLYFPDKYLTGTLSVLYADDRLLAVEKPQGLPVDADEMGIGADTALIRAKRMYPAARLCHRLDTGTGGVLLLALNEEAEDEMCAAFENHQVSKTYHAMLKGMPGEGGALRHYLVKDEKHARVSVYDRPRPGALEARLSYRTLTKTDDCARVEIALYTGRTHQIRAQMAHIGCPVVGDDKYGDRELNRAKNAKYPCLWCVRLKYRDMDIQSTAPFDVGEANGWTSG